MNFGPSTNAVRFIEPKDVAPTAISLDTSSVSYKVTDALASGKARTAMLAKELLSEHKEQIAAVMTSLQGETKETFKKLLVSRPEDFLTTDSKGVTLIERLAEIKKSPVDSLLIQGLEANRAEIHNTVLTGLIERIANKGYVEQSDKSTCLSAATESRHFRQNMAEFTRVISEWTKNGKATLQSGISVPLNIQGVLESENQSVDAGKYPQRDLVSRMYQESSSLWMSKLEEWKGASYDPATTTWKTRDGKEFQGFFEQQQQRWEQAFTNRSSTINFVQELGGNGMLQAIENSLNTPEGRGGILVAVNWDSPGGAHGQHALLVTAIHRHPQTGEILSVEIMNSHHGKTNGPQDRELKKIEGGINGAKTEFLSADLFASIILTATIPDSPLAQNSIHSFTNDPYLSERNYVTVNGITILNIAPYQYYLEEQKKEKEARQTSAPQPSSQVVFQQTINADGEITEYAPNANGPRTADLSAKYYLKHQISQINAVTNVKPRDFSSMGENPDRERRIAKNSNYRPMWEDKKVEDEELANV